MLNNVLFGNVHYNNTKWAVDEQRPDALTEIVGKQIEQYYIGMFKRQAQPPWSSCRRCRKKTVSEIRTGRELIGIARGWEPRTPTRSACIASKPTAP